MSTTQISFKNPDAPATSKQTWLLFTLTKTDWRDKGLTIKQASEKIAALMEAKKKGINTVTNTPALDYRVIYNTAIAAANMVGNSTQQVFFCGFASVIIRDSRKGFAKWLKDNHIGYHSSRGMSISPQGDAGITQSMNVKEAWCNEFAQMLIAQGIDSNLISVTSRAD